jgi:hypothetical protein
MGVGAECQAPADLPPVEGAGTHFTEGWVDPTAGPDWWR